MGQKKEEMGSERETLEHLEQRVFDIADEPMPKGAWWWWFWLFFFDNPKDPRKPRQLMILWSSKNVKRIRCNELELEFDTGRGRGCLDGAVAAWYFDGERMRHDFLLEQCDLRFSDSELRAGSSPPTSFSVDGTRNTVRIGDDFEFVAEAGGKHGFVMPQYHSNSYIGKLGYKILRLNHLDLSGTVGGEPIKGSAYFQRVFVNAPAIPWYWGVFHFENGGILTYFNPRVLGKSVKRDIALYDGSGMHEFDDIRVERRGGEVPSFYVRGENEKERIRFLVEAYSHSSWTFRKKTLGVIPNKFVYNEYPAAVSRLELTDKATGQKTTQRDLGESVGNAEHATGFLL